MLSLGGSRGNSYDEFMPEAGVEGNIVVTGSLRNDFVPVSGAISGDYNYSYRAPVHESHSFGASLSGISLGSLSEFGDTLSRGIFSGVAGYAAGRALQSLGAGDFISSLGGSIASIYVSDALADTFDSDNSSGAPSPAAEKQQIRVDAPIFVGQFREFV